MIKAIIFDCFGVLISDALQVLCDELRARDPDAARRIGDLIKASNRGMIDPKESNAQVAAILGLSVDEYRTKIRDGEVKNHEVLQYVRELRRTYKTAMLSNISATGLTVRFTPDELQECFDTVVASGEIGYAKPEPEAYEIVAERLGVRLDECAFTDDRIEFCEAARAVGMQSIEFQDLTQFKRDLAPLLDPMN